MLFNHVGQIDELLLRANRRVNNHRGKSWNDKTRDYVQLLRLSFWFNLLVVFIYTEEPYLRNSALN